MIMPNLKDFLIAETVIKDEKLEFKFEDVVENNEILRLLRENMTKKGDENEKADR